MQLLERYILIFSKKNFNLPMLIFFITQNPSPASFSSFSHKSVIIGIWSGWNLEAKIGTCWKGGRVLSLHTSPCIFRYFWKFAKNGIFWISLPIFCFKIKFKPSSFDIKQKKKFYLVILPFGSGQEKTSILSWKPKFQLFSL